MRARQEGPISLSELLDQMDKTVAPSGGVSIEVGPTTSVSVGRIVEVLSGEGYLSVSLAESRYVVSLIIREPEVLRSLIRKLEAAFLECEGDNDVR